MSDANGHPLQLGDLICHRRWNAEDGGDCNVGHVVGFGPDCKWVRIKTLDGRRRLWLDTNIHNVDADCGEGNYAS